MSQESDKPAEKSKAAKFGFFMLRGALYVGNALTVGLLCFAAQILFYMLCFLAAIALFILVAIVLPISLAVIGCLIGSAELALLGIIVALVVWGALLACATGVRINLGIEDCIQPVGEYIMVPWEYVNKKISTIGKESNQEINKESNEKQDDVSGNTEKNRSEINLTTPVNNKESITESSHSDENSFELPRPNGTDHQGALNKPK